MATTPIAFTNGTAAAMHMLTRVNPWSPNRATAAAIPTYTLGRTLPWISEVNAGPFNRNGDRSKNVDATTSTMAATNAATMGSTCWPDKSARAVLVTSSAGKNT